MRKRLTVAALVCVTNLCLVTRAAYADVSAYALTDVGAPIVSNTRLATLDLTTGVYTAIGNTGNLGISGLGSVGGTLYTANNDTLFSINASNGSLTSVGSLPNPLSYEGLGSTATGLFTVDILSENLLSINPSTGAPTVVGPTGLTFVVDAMSTGPGGLFISSPGVPNLTGTDFLWKLNISTGAATQIGDTGLAFLTGMVWINGTLYGVSGTGFPTNSSFSVVTLDTTTGAASHVVNTSGAGNFVATGLAPTTSVPEPSSLVLIGSGLVATFEAARRKLLNR